MIPGSANPLLLKSAAAAGGYQVSRSLRFNSSDSGFCSRTPAVAGNRRTWTWAGWVKRSALGGRQFIITGNVNADANYWEFDSSNKLHVSGNDGTSQAWDFTTTQVFRDVSSWYHLVITFNSTEATTGDRVKIYINGSRIINFDYSGYPVLNYETFFNQAVEHDIGSAGGAGLYLNGYLADIHFIDGQALTPSSFTEVSATTGQLIPKAYSGTFGTNGFWLKFSDNSAATAATLGKDYSGNSNNWTPNNLSVTAGAGNDSLVDTPTSFGTDTYVGGEVRGNYATLNPLQLSNSNRITLSNGNLQGAGNSVYYGSAISTIAVNSGKWYAEFTFTLASTIPFAGIIKTNPLDSAYQNTDDQLLGRTANGYGYRSNQQLYNNNSISTYGASWTDGDAIGVALDLDAGTLTFYKNGVSQGQAASGLSGYYAIGCSVYSSAVCNANFGQRAFAYPAPSGFKALCDTNLPEGTITTSGTYTGNGVADGPFVYLNGVPTAMTVGGNAVTFGTHADKLSNGFKLRTTSTTYNQNALSYNYSITATGAKFKYARAQPNP